MSGTYVHPADPSRDNDPKLALYHAEAAREQHQAGQLHDHAACGIPHRASCPSPAHADELADFGDCSACGTVAPQLPAAKASAAETPGTIASACAFGWGA